MLYSKMFPEIFRNKSHQNLFNRTEVAGTKLAFTFYDMAK